MTFKGRLLSSTANVKRFQAENRYLSPPEWQAPLHVRISQSRVVIENQCGGATRPRKKFYVIFIRFDTIPAVTDGHVAIAKTALAERRAGKKNF